MKHTVNARIAAAAVLIGVAVAVVPEAGHAQATLSAKWSASSAPGPPPRAGSSIAFDPIRQRTIMFGGSDGGSYFSDTWAYDGSTWTQTQISGPSGRYLAPMVFDSSRGAAVLFGGYNFFGVQGDTWEWTGSTWNRKLTAHTPPLRLWTAMAYDSVHHLTVLFGGAIDTGLFNDTWVYDGNDWAQVTTAHAPTPRRGLGLAFDAARGRTVLFGGQDSNGVDLNDTWEFDGVDWTQVTTGSSPPGRLWHSMAYDPGLGGVLVLGGAGFGTNAPLGDTWLYDGATWQQVGSTDAWSGRFWTSAAYETTRGDVVLFGGSTTPFAPGGQIFGDTWNLTGTSVAALDWTQANPATSPSPRVWSQMDYDSARGVSVLFGGSSDSGSGNLSDTWTWNGVSWNKMSPASSPPAVAGGMMAYDTARGVSVLFGGSASGGTSSATWEWDGTNWTQRSLAVSPPARVWASMTYDSSRHRMVLFGGDGSNGMLNDTWEYDGTAWVQVHPAASPTPRDGPALGFDPTRGRTVLFGGHSSTGRLADTWEWDGTSWTLIQTATGPSPRFWASLVFDQQRGKIVLFGGDHFQPYDLGESNDTWEWDGATWTEDWPATAPAIRSGAVMTYDLARGRLVLFGGWNAATSPVTIYGDSWELGTGIQTPAGTQNATLDVGGFGLNLGNVNVGSTSNGGAAFRLTSTGTGPLTVNSITATGSDFPMTTDCPVGGNVLPTGSYCETVVFFTPTAGGTRTGTITFDYNAPGGNQTFQLQGTGVVIPTTLTISPVVAMYNGGATVTASLRANGVPFPNQPVTLTLPNGATVTTATDASGVAIWFSTSFAGIHAGTYPTGVQASFFGSPAYAPSSATAQLVLTQPVSSSYNGDFVVADSSGATLAVTVDQRTPASDPQFIDYTTNSVWARFTVTGPATSSDYYARLNDASNWSTTGLGVGTIPSAALPDGAYTVTVTLVDGPGSTSLSTTVAGDDSRTALASSPTKAGYLSGGGAIASDPSANTPDTHGYFSMQMKPGSRPTGNFVYVYRVRMDLGGGNVRDVDVWVTGTDVTSLSGNSSTATAMGHFNVAYVDAMNGQRYTAFEFSGGTYRLNAANATNKAPAGFGLVLQRADGTTFHATGSSPTSDVVLGTIVCHL